jgi:hypothetical protein
MDQPFRAGSAARISDRPWFTVPKARRRRKGVPQLSARSGCPEGSRSRLCPATAGDREERGWKTLPCWLRPFVRKAVNTSARKGGSLGIVGPTIRKNHERGPIGPIRCALAHITVVQPAPACNGMKIGEDAERHQALSRSPPHRGVARGRSIFAPYAKGVPSVVARAGIKRSLALAG